MTTPTQPCDVCETMQLDIPIDILDKLIDTYVRAALGSCAVEAFDISIASGASVQDALHAAVRDHMIAVVLQDAIDRHDPTLMGSAVQPDPSV